MPHVLNLIKHCCSFNNQSINQSIKLYLTRVTRNSSVLEYACEAFHSSLPAYLSDQIERVQKRVLRILFPAVSYSNALEEAGLKTLFNRRGDICSTLFNQIVESDGQHKLADLLPMRNDNERYNFRNRRKNEEVWKYFYDALCR